MAYTLTSTVRGETLTVDLEDIGFAGESLAAPGRVVTHQLTTGDYQVRSQGYGPLQVTYLGEYDPGSPDAENVLNTLIMMRGHEVMIRRGTDSKTGHLRNVNPTYHDWRRTRFMRVSWRADVVLDQDRTLVVASGGTGPSLGGL